MRESGLVQLLQMPMSAIQVSSSDKPSHVRGVPGPDGTIPEILGLPPRGRNEETEAERGGLLEGSVFLWESNI